MFKKGKEFHVVWIGPDSLHSGYGSSNLGLLRALGETKVRTHAKGSGSFDVGIAYIPAARGHIEELATPYTVLYTMFEADRWPDHWVGACQCVNQVWVPSSFCKESLVRSGVQTPVEIVPLGFDPDQYHPNKTDGTNKGTFRIGFAGTASIRKGYNMLVEAFSAEFSPNEKVELIVRSASILSGTYPADRRAKILEGRLSPDAMREFYHSIDLLVLPTKGEGFGLTPLESMACGTPVAVTNWGGSMDYLGDHALRIGIEGLEKCPQYHQSSGSWARPSMASLRYCLRWAFGNRDELIEMGKASADYAHANWTYRRSAESVERLIAAIKPNERVAVEVRDVVTWHGDPQKVTTQAGGFIRGIPREITKRQKAQLNPSDIGPSGFVFESRYARKTSDS